MRLRNRRLADVFQLGSTGGHRCYYPPTTGHPYLVVTFLADWVLQATPFDSEEDAEAFIDRDARGRPAKPL